MDIFGIDETLAGLKRGAERFGTRVAAAVVRKMARRVNASNGFSPNEPEPYGAGMGGADTEQESQVPSQALNAEPAKDKSGANGYIGLYKGKQYEVYADSSYGAQKKLAAQLGAKRESDVDVFLAEKDVNKETGKGTQVTTHLDNSVTKKIAIRGDEYEVAVVDPTHVTLKLVGGSGTPWAVHVAQLDDETVRQLQAAGIMDERRYVNNVDSSALGYQSAQRTTTAQRGEEKLGNDGPLLSRCPACGLDSQEEWAGKCAGCGTENEKDAGDNAAVRENSVHKNSYGNVYIDGDIKRGLTDEQIASKIGERYPHVGKSQALRIVSQVRKGGPDASADWGDESSDIMASSKENAKLPFDMSCDSCGKKLVQESQVAQCEKCDANLCGACRERVAGDTYCEKCAEDARQNTSAKENAVKFRVESLDDGRWEVAFGSGRAGEIFEDKKEAERRALELNDGRKNADHPDSAKIIKEHYGLDRMPTDQEIDDEIANLKRKAEKGNLDDKQRDLHSRLRLNAGHMGPDAWIAASLDERCAWLESAGLDVNLATLRFQDLSEDAHVALQDRMDMPASRNNLGALAAGAKHGAASVESTGEDLPGPASMGGGALGNASGPTKCSWCLGTGMGPCPKCEGEYETSKDCICKGTGHTKCADCKGTGKIENASGPTKIFSFKDANGEVETVAAESEQEAWKKLSRDFGISIEDIHGMGIKLASVRENSKAQEPCPTCGLPKQMRPAGGDENSFVCGNRKCSSFKNDIDLEDHGTHKKCPVCAGPVKWQEGLGQSSHEYACARCGQNFDETELKNSDPDMPTFCDICEKRTRALTSTPDGDICAECKKALDKEMDEYDKQSKGKKNSDSVGDLEEIARHAEGIEHEVGEMMDEKVNADNANGTCYLCGNSVNLEKCHTDEHGKPFCSHCDKIYRTDLVHSDNCALCNKNNSNAPGSDTRREMMKEGVENRSIPESKIGEEIAHHIKDKGMDPDQAIAAAYSETRNSGVRRGQDKYGSKDK